MKIVDLLLEAGKLKSLKRAGWVRGRFPDPESVAEHSFRVCFLLMLLAKDLKVKEGKLFKMALLHDIDEAQTGDIVRERGEKYIVEDDEDVRKKAAKKILVDVGGSKELYKLWENHIPEGKDETSRDADILYQIGKVATAWQALEYELGGVDPSKLDEWWINARARVKEPLLIKLLDQLEARRKK